jgi:chromate transporter
VLPGANQVNLAVYVGAKLHGLRGAVAAVLGLLALPLAIVLVLAWLYGRYGELPALQAVLRGAVCVAVAMTFAMVWQTGRKCLRSLPAWALFLACLALSGGLRVSLPLVLLLLGPPALWWGARSAARAP